VVGKLFAKLADNKLGADLPSELPRLFRERSARVVPNHDSEYAQSRLFDHAVATVVTPDLHLRISRTPSGFAIDAAPPADPTRWQPVDAPGVEWPGVDDFLTDNWERLRAALLH
jgi:hypothetical protein